MTSEEIGRAMRLRLPVMVDGRKYDRIAEYVMWYDGSGNRRLSCGVITNNCIMRVPADKVEPAEVTE